MVTLLIVSGVFYLFAHRYYWRNSSEIFDNGPGFELISHRGLKSVAPENTTEAFLAAVDSGFNWVEVDVMTTSDRAIVCSHNFDLEKETIGRGYITELEYIYCTTTVSYVIYNIYIKMHTARGEESNQNNNTII